MGLNKDRGLSSLISDMDTVYSKELGFDKNQSTMIEIDQISPNPFQPRKNFDQEALDELANSIKEFGLIQPIIVFKKNNKFILIAGERRLRAVKALGKKEILAFIADIDENKLRELALIENIQRENLNPIELANSYKDLMQVHKITQENLAELIHKSRTQITNTLRLLNLDIRTQELIASGKISQGHAKVLVGLDQKDEKMLVDSIIGQKLNVRDHIHQKAYLNALKLDYEGIKPNLTPIKAPILKHNPFEFPLSFSRFNLLENQKRTYYYRYILNLAEPRVLSEESKAKNQGNFIHKMLEIYYKNYANNDFDINVFANLLDKEYQKYNISELDLEVFKLKFIQFAKNEKEHFSKGFYVAHTELELNNILKLGTDSIKLKGTIDRIDSSKEGNLIIDYKSGKVPSNSYQLAFYQALYDENASVGFYDLNSMQILHQKAKSLDELRERLKDLVLMSKEEIEFENEQDEYCPYKLIYKKELK